MYTKNLHRWLLPFLQRCEEHNPGSSHALLREYLVTMAIEDLSLCLKVFEASKANVSMPKDSAVLKNLAVQKIQITKICMNLSLHFQVYMYLFPKYLRLSLIPGMPPSPSYCLQMIVFVKAKFARTYFTFQHTNAFTSKIIMICWFPPLFTAPCSHHQRGHRTAVSIPWVHLCLPEVANLMCILVVQTYFDIVYWWFEY